MVSLCTVQPETMKQLLQLKPILRLGIRKFLDCSREKQREKYAGEGGIAGEKKIPSKPLQYVVVDATSLVNGIDVASCRKQPIIYQVCTSTQISSFLTSNNWLVDIALSC